MSPAYPPANSMLAAQEGRLHLPFLDGLRGLVSFYVVAHHIYAYSWISGGKSVPKAPFWLNWLQYGHFAVMIFIVLSGFCLVLPFVSGKPKKPGWIKTFYYRRARRILPAYYAAVLVSLAVAAICPPVPSVVTWGRSATTAGGLLSHLLLFQDIFGPGQINYAHWSVALEWQIYFLFPFLLWAFFRLGHGAGAALAMLLGFAGRAALDFGGVVPWSLATQYIGGFALGMWAAWVVVPTGAKTRTVNRWFLWPLVAAAGCILAHLVVPEAYRYLLKDAFVSIASAVMLIVLTSNAATGAWTSLSRILSSKPLLFLGAMSYSLYLVHPAILEFFEAYIVRHIPFPSVLQEFWFAEIAGLLSITLVSYGFYLLCERPYLAKSIPKVVDCRVRKCSKNPLL